jgi:hypothetical protein
MRLTPAPIRSAERLAYWYFRLNGFLTTENFIVHPDTGRDQRTDADLLGVRFAHRAENLARPMEDDPKVVSCRTLVNVIIAEVKTGPCALNGPWTNPDAGNMRRLLRSVGCVPEVATGHACDSLYNSGVWSDPNVTIRLFALGESENADLVISTEQQLTWTHVIGFCVKRLLAYEREKSSVGQWAADGRRLRALALGSKPEERIRMAFGLRSNPDPVLEGT